MSGIGEKLRKLFKLPEDTRSFDISVVGDDVIIKCEYVPGVADLIDVGLVTAEFELIERK